MSMMINAQRWADAFITVTGDPSPAVALLNAWTPLMARLPGHVTGRSAAQRITRALLDAMKHASPGDGAVPAAETSGETAVAAACRLLGLLVERGAISALGDVTAAIEQTWERRQGVIHAVLETAVPLEDASALITSVEQAVLKKTGARRVQITNRVVPALLAGYRLCIGSERLDASAAGQMRQLAQCMGVNTW